MNSNSTDANYHTMLVDAVTVSTVIKFYKELYYILQMVYCVDMTA